ncbi:glycoside hydrolase family 5 protein [Bacteroides finegoldii]|uniref:glycoside hydrolase family 5 protein n=1 Tax=Bacteroides finegoldii TaxID=338188 RepID=UPI0018A0C610
MKINFRILYLLSLMFAAMLCHAQQTARQWNSEVTAGWNLGNQFECSAPGQDSESIAVGDPEGADNAETAWGNPLVTKKTIKAVRDAGFNAIRIPVRWQCHISNPSAMSISRIWMDRIKEVIDWCLEYNLKVIVNVHHEKWLESRPLYANKEENCQKLALLWLNIANELNKYDYRVAFAGTNEVHEPDKWGKPTTENLNVQNAYNQTFIDIVRATGMNNAKRHLIVQTYACNADYGLYNGDFIIPTDIEGNDYMSVELHYYNPWEYVGSGECYYWGEPYKQYGASRSDENTMIKFFNKLADEWSAKGLGVVIGEWGITNHFKASEADRMRENMSYYCKTLVSEARKRGFSTFVWDNNRFGNGADMFGIFDRSKNMSIKADWVIKGIKEGVADSAK